jgi:hypothetical protein
VIVPLAWSLVTRGESLRPFDAIVMLRGEAE